MEENNVYVRQADPGHSWLEVPVSELNELRISAYITGYSYISNDRKTAYLEEDCDESTFWAAFILKYGHGYKTAEQFSEGESFVRGLNGFVGYRSNEYQAKTLELMRAAAKKWGVEALPKAVQDYLARRNSGMKTTAIN